MIDPEKFELLSAYLDGEASDAERALVESWLVTDRTVQQYYAQQTRLRQLWQTPAVSNQLIPSSSVEKTWRYIESRQQQRWLWIGITTLVASMIGVISISLPISSKWQQANAEEPLLLALEKPLIPIPKSMLYR